MSKYAELEKTLAAHGWRYDAKREMFTDGKRRIDYRKVLSFLPGMTIDDLAGYVNQQHEQYLSKSAPPQ